jgi:hypothetical protein
LRTGARSSGPGGALHPEPGLVRAQVAAHVVKVGVAQRHSYLFGLKTPCPMSSLSRDMLPFLARRSTLTRPSLPLDRKAGKLLAWSRRLRGANGSSTSRAARVLLHRADPRLHGGKVMDQSDRPRPTSWGGAHEPGLTWVHRGVHRRLPQAISTIVYCRLNRRRGSHGWAPE